MVVPVRIELLTTGTELLLGTTRDTHGAWVGQRLLGLGLRIARQVTAPDGQAVGKAMRTGLEEGEVLIVTGGLGPTSDDLTRESLAEVLGLEVRRRQGEIRRRIGFMPIPVSNTGRGVWQRMQSPWSNRPTTRW